MRHARKIGLSAAMCLAGLCVGCASAPSADATRSHAELSREANLDRDARLFAVGDSVGARMLRRTGSEGAESPVFARSTPAGFQAADAIGAAALSSRPTVATVIDDE
jgi:hypothetical protein